jgi:hypothetical protein
MINSVVQIILSIFLIAIMAFISYSIYNNEVIKNITINTSTKKQVKIFTGILDYTKDNNIDIETYDFTNKSYLDINPSINQNGGAEYSYNFWLFFDVTGGDKTIVTLTSANSLASYSSDSGADNNPDFKYRYINLFYKGEQNYIPINTNALECEQNPNLKDNVKENIFIKNPLVKIRNDAKDIIVEYNNINFPETYNTNAIPLSCSASSDANNDLNNRNKNKLGIKDIDVEKYKQKFNMITIVFQEQPKNEDIFNKNSANCKVYFNGVLIEDRLANTAAIESTSEYNKALKSRVMKSNLSKLHINPNINSKAFLNRDLKTRNTSSVNDSNKKIKISPLQMADLTYYNYALTVKEINAIYNKGFNTNSVTYTTNVYDNVLFQKGKYIEGKTIEDKTVKGI